MSTIQSWTTFVDPFEHAFTITIPAGWRVTGGLLRHSPIDPNMCMRLVSPDMRTLIILGDPQMGIYLTPQPALLGWLSPPPGPIPQRPYLSGVDYARAYVLETLAKTLDAVALIGQKPRPDLAQGRHTQFNPMARHDGGEATFTCQRGGEAAVGFIGVDTYIYGWPMQGGVLWGVGLLLGFVAPPEGVAAATEIMVQSATSRADRYDLARASKGAFGCLRSGRSRIGRRDARSRPGERGPHDADHRRDRKRSARELRQDPSRTRCAATTNGRDRQRLQRLSRFGRQQLQARQHQGVSLRRRPRSNVVDEQSQRAGPELGTAQEEVVIESSIRARTNAPAWARLAGFGWIFLGLRVIGQRQSDKQCSAPTAL
jgi:hypothetical protein